MRGFRRQSAALSQRTQELWFIHYAKNVRARDGSFFGDKLQGCEAMHQKKWSRGGFTDQSGREDVICDIICWSVWLGDEPVANRGARFDTSGLKSFRQMFHKTNHTEIICDLFEPLFLFLKALILFFVLPMISSQKKTVWLYISTDESEHHMGPFFPFFFCFFFGKDINMHITVLDEKYNHKRLFHHLCPGVHRMHKTPALAERLCMCLDSRRTVSTAYRRKRSTSVNEWRQQTFCPVSTPAATLIRRVRTRSFSKQPEMKDFFSHGLLLHDNTMDAYCTANITVWRVRENKKKEKKETSAAIIRASGSKSYWTLRAAAAPAAARCSCSDTKRAQDNGPVAFSTWRLRVHNRRHNSPLLPRGVMIPDNKREPAPKRGSYKLRCQRRGLRFLPTENYQKKSIAKKKVFFTSLQLSWR